MQKGCPKCGRMIDSKYEICPNCNYDFKEITNFFQKVGQKEYVEEEKYGGFIKRLIAGLIDICIIDLICYIINLYLKMDVKVLSIFSILIYILSNAILERTPWRGSFGKKILDLEVTDEYENPITFPKALIRNISKIANVLTIGIGFLTCVAPPYKQTLADRISKTLVLNKKKNHEEKLTEASSIFKRVLAFIIDIVIIVIIVLIKNEIVKYLASNNIYEISRDINQIITGIIILAYFPLKEEGKGQTYGKKIMNIKVTNLNDNRLTYLKSFIRELLIVADVLTLGFLLPFSNRKKQTLKDVLTKTVVIDE